MKSIFKTSFASDGVVGDNYKNLIFNKVIVYNYVCAMLALRRPYLLIDKAMVNNNTIFNVKQTSTSQFC